MHPSEQSTHASLVRKLLASQFPHWSDLPIVPVPSFGTDHALYRIGDDLVVRLPRMDWAVGQGPKEYRWLPKLAPLLPLQIPEPVALGEPGHGFPWPWAIHRWIEGENRSIDQLPNPEQVSMELATFIRALHRIDATGGPLPENPASSRGIPIAQRDAEVRTCISQLSDTLDEAAALAVWNDAISAPSWEEQLVWIHGDLQAGNLLFRDDQLIAVIDFGSLAVGDPACDIMAAWLYLSAKTRPRFRETLQVDEATWRRARGWALAVAVVALPYYRDSNPTLAAIALSTLQELFSDAPE